MTKSYCLVADSRDSNKQNCLTQYDDIEERIGGYTRCYLCNKVCSVQVAPLAQINKIKSIILAQKDNNYSRPIRHRKVSIDLVKSHGWLDECKFGVMVVGNYSQDIQGLLSIAPLSVRLLASGKFPFSFESSEDVNEVREIITSIQEEMINQKNSLQYTSI